MRTISVEFGRPRLWSAPLVAWTLLCLLTAALLVWQGVRQFERAIDIERRAEVVAAALRSLDQATHMAAARDAATPRLQAYDRDALTLSKTAAFPTQGVLRALESTAADSIRIQNIDLRPAQGSAEVTVEFTDYAGLLAWVAQLNEGDSTAPWQVVKAQDAVRKQAVVRLTVRR